MSTVHVMVSPAAGRGRAARAADTVLTTIESRGHTVVDLSGPDAATTEAAAHEAVAAGAERIIAVGGDGIVHLALQAVAQSDTVLGIVPVGTGNDFAGALGLSTDPATAALAALGAPIELDGLRAGDRWVASVATAGFSGLVNERANAMRFPRGSARYTVATVREIPVLANRAVRITADGHTTEFNAAMVAVANTSDFGGGMQVCPEATATDGVLDVTVVADVGRIELLRFLHLVFDGRHLTHPKVHTLRGQTISIEAADLQLWGDGELVGAMPIACTAEPGAIRLAR